MGWANKFILIESRIAYLYEQMNQDTLSKEEYAELQYLLLWKYMLSDGDYTNMNLQEQVSVANIDSDKIMFISNTHFGYDEATSEYVQKVYHYALQLGISTVVHAGDAIEGALSCQYDTTHKTFDSYEHLKEQLDYFLRYLPDPEEDGIQTKLLLGNRDYWAIREAPLLLNDFFASNKVEILGINKVLLNFQKKFLIGLYHGLSVEEAKSAKEEMISLIGYSHLYPIEGKNTLIRIPQLCDIFHNSFDSITDTSPAIHHSPVPIFITLERVEEEQFQFCQYSMEDSRNARVLDETIVNMKTKQIIRCKK